MELLKLKSAIEAILLISGDGLTESEISNGLEIDKKDAKTILDTLMDDYDERDGGILIQKIKGKYKFVTRSNVYEQVKKFISEKKKSTLSKSMLETLAIITYKQPITLHEIEELRGVNSRSLTMALVSRKLVKSLGQKESPGRPTLFGTTKEFLDYLGINALDDLPPPQDIKELNFEEL